jgi:hypothetical protein
MRRALIPLCFLLVGCASAEGPSGLAHTHQVLLVRQPPPTGTYPGEMQMRAANASLATDRYSTQQVNGYLLISFSDGDPHKLKLTVNRQTGENMYTRDVSISAHPSWSLARGTWATFPIQNSLNSGRYALELMIDDRPAGSYPFIIE